MANGLWPQIGALGFGRLVVNISRRYAYAFAPQLARSLGVPLSAVQNMIALQGAVGLISPFTASLSERFGRKAIMQVALGLNTAAGVLGALAPTYGIFVLMMLMFGFGKLLFDPSMLAYLGDRVPFHKRARAIGVTELSWAGSLLVAAPLIGFLLERSTLSVVFGALAFGSLLGLIVISIMIPSDRPTSKSLTTLSLRGLLRVVFSSGPARAALAFGFLNTCANEIVFINYGAFMERSFDLALSALGFVTIAISIAEILGESVIISVGDRFGSKRISLVGIAVAGVCYVLLPVVGTSLEVAVGIVFVMFLAFEMAIVGIIPLNTEVLPHARGAMMAGMIGAGSIGRVTGVVIGGGLYALTDSFVPGAVIAGVMAALGFYVLFRFVRVAVSDTVQSTHTNENESQEPIRDSDVQ